MKFLDATLDSKWPYFAEKILLQSFDETIEKAEYLRKNGSDKWVFIQQHKTNDNFKAVLKANLLAKRCFKKKNVQN